MIGMRWGIDGMPVELIDTVTGERTNLDPEKYFKEFVH